MEDKEKIIHAIKGFKNKNIAVIGDVIIDKYIYGKVERLNPESTSAPLLKIEDNELKLGGAANVAANLSSLGAKSSLFCVVGKDYQGILFENLCAKCNIELFSIKEGETIIKERVIESEFNRCLIRVDHGESNLKSITSKHEDVLYKNITKQRPMSYPEIRLPRQKR